MRRLTGFLAFVLVVSACGGGGGDSSASGDAGSSGGGTGALIAEFETAATARFMSDDGSPLSPDRSFVQLFDDDLQVSSNAASGFTNAFGLPDLVTPANPGRVSRWDFPGGAFVEAHDGRRMTAHCGTAGVFGHVGEGVLLCISTLNEAKAALADGMADFVFTEDAESAVASSWNSCDAASTFDQAIIEIWVNATGSEDRGFSSAQVTGDEIINGIELRKC
jgi:hypothetical protein